MTAMGVAIREMFRASSVSLFHINFIVTASAYSVAIDEELDIRRSKTEGSHIIPLGIDIS